MQRKWKAACVVIKTYKLFTLSEKYAHLGHRIISPTWNQFVMDFYVTFPLKWVDYTLE